MVQEKIKVIIASDYDKRLYEWLLTRYSKNDIDRAVTELKGNRKPYLSNIIKILGVIVPDDLEKTPRSEARKHLAKIKSLIK